MDEVLTKEQQTIKEDIWRACDVNTIRDMVNHPPHYTQGDVECIDAIKASMEPIEYIGFLKGQVIKYIWRFEKKWNPQEDLNKTKFYLDKLIEFAKEQPDGSLFSQECTLRVDSSSSDKIDAIFAASNIADGNEKGDCNE